VLERARALWDTPRPGGFPVRVLLIQPPFLNATSSKVFPSPSHACLAAVLLPLPGVEVKVFDGLLDRLYEDQDADAARRHLQNTIHDFQPDLIGVTHTFTWHRNDMAWTAKAIREVSDRPVVMGGNHATVSYEDVLARGEADVVVLGEGEHTLVELVQRMAAGEGLTDVAGTAGCHNGNLYTNPPRPLIDDLDTLPMPAWDVFPMEKYFSFNSPALNMRRPKTIMLTSRGCMGSCVYCAAHNIWGRRRWRGRSAEKVLDEIEFLYHEYGVREIDFEDDNLAADAERLAAICQMILDRKLDFRWKAPGGIGHWTIDLELLKLMRASGCYRLTFGIESASPKNRRWLGKNWDLKQAGQIIDAAHDMGMWVNATFIIGTPVETREDIAETVEWYKRSNIDFMSFGPPLPLPGTPMHKMYERLGYEVGLDALDEYTRGPHATEHFTKEEITRIHEDIKRMAMRRLLTRFLNPRTLLKKINSVEDARYVFGLMRFYANLVLHRRSVQELSIKQAKRLS